MSRLLSTFQKLKIFSRRRRQLSVKSEISNDIMLVVTQRTLRVYKERANGKVIISALKMKIDFGSFFELNFILMPIFTKNFKKTSVDLKRYVCSLDKSRTTSTQILQRQQTQRKNNSGNSYYRK